LQKKTQKFREIALHSQEKTAMAQKNQQQKGAPYRQDPLFMYLWEAQYGTKNYKGSFLIRFFDSMIARLVGYYNAKPNFAMLNEIPLRLSEHANYQAELAKKSEEELDELEQEAIDKAGGKPARIALLKAQQDIEKIDAQMLNLEDERDEKAHDYHLLAQGKEPVFEKAALMLAKNLAREDINSLMNIARQTSTPDDNIVISKIDDIKNLIEAEKPDVKSLKSRLQTLGQRRRELEDIEWEFKKSRFDDPRSTFRNNSLTKDLLSEFLRGAITAATYWAAWQNSQSWRAGSSDWGGGIGLPRSGRRSSRGSSSPWSSSRPRSSRAGFSRPRSSSSRRSGGFKTGGGF
jgi:hypothetical protein